LREGLNVRSTFRFNALITPIRANIVGPPNVATRIKASIAGLPLRSLMLGLRKLHDVIAGVLEGDELATAGQRDRITNARFQPCRDFILRRLMRMCARCERR
jgi:hypothetical protein